MPPEPFLETTTPDHDRPRRSPLVLIFAVLSFAILIGTALFLGTPPASFSESMALEIEPGTSVSDISVQAEEAGLVRSSFLLYIILTYWYEPADLYAGVYQFSTPVSVLEVARNLGSRNIRQDHVILTVPEGTRATTIATLANNALVDFDEDAFVDIATPYEGYLFPDTYHIPPTFSEEQLLQLMRETYDEKLENVALENNPSELTAYEVLVLASILEREANSEESMRTVSGILQNRLAIDMPLQADASIEYVLDKPLGELTPDDLRIDSPYNTYLNQGLPPTPIGNPGTQSIHAVLEPIETDFFYYLTTPDGTFHYARTYDQHQDNIERYLR